MLSQRMDHTAAFYSGPSYGQRGSGFPVFAGSRRQRGGSILGALKSLVLPALSNIGKSALKQAVGLASDVAGDVMSGRQVGQSLKQHGVRRLKNVGRSGLRTVINQVNPTTRQVSGKRRVKRRRRSTKKTSSKRQRLF